MAYAGDCIEITAPDVDFAGPYQCLLVLQCEDLYPAVDITDCSPIDFVTGGAMYLFPFIYEYDGHCIDLDYVLECCTKQSSLSLADIFQVSTGNGVAYRVNALRVHPGDNCLELVLTDVLPGDIYADFIAFPTVGTIPMEVTFLNRSDSLQGIDHYLWSFGDGTRSDQENPIHTFEQLGKFSVTLTVYGPDGQDTIRKFEYVIAERQFMKKCLHYGVNEEHGPGWSERGGDNWIWPESQAAILTIINNSYRQEIVFNQDDGLPYWIDTRDGPANSGLVKCWRDKVHPLIADSGTVQLWEILFGEYTGELEQYFVEMLETYMVFRTVKNDNIGATGYDASGLPTSLQVNYDLLKDGLLVAYAGSTLIPVKRDIVVDRKEKGNALQIKLSGQNSEFKLRKIESFLKVSDFAHNTTSLTEITYQETLSNPVMWFSRESNLINRCTGQLIYAGSITNITGPDSRDDSAFRISSTLQLSNSAYASGTLMVWHKTGFSISGVSLTEVGQSGSWILSYANNIPANLLFTSGDVFDIRIFDVAVSLAAMQHYFSNVSEYQGDMYLP